MNDDETPRQRMAIRGPAKALTDLAALDIDQRPATSTWAVEERPDGSYVGVLRVDGHGAIVLRAVLDPETGKLRDDGVTLFTERQIEAGEL